MASAQAQLGRSFFVILEVPHCRAENHQITKATNIHPPQPSLTLLEWGPANDAEQQFAGALNQELSLDALIARDPSSPTLQDDRRVNEYFILRRVRDPKYLEGLRRRMLARVGIKS